MRPKLDKLFLVALCSLNLLGCGGAVVKSSGPSIKYYIEKLNTNTTSNYLIIEASQAEGFTYTIDGYDLTADIALSEENTLRAKTLLTYPGEGEYYLDLKIRNSSGEKFIDDTLSWDYSLEKPSLPIVNFSENATNDDYVILLLASSLARKTTEIWVEGDLAGEAGWTIIPPTLQIPLQVSASDGLKTFKIKYRNIYGNESELIETSILKKSVGPQNCVALLAAPTSSQALLRIYLAAENEGPLFYSVQGDLDKYQAVQRFNNNTVALVELSHEAGEKNLLIKIKDTAGNACPDLPLSMTLDPSYKNATSSIDDEALWTADFAVTLSNRYDFLLGDVAEMYIDGGVDDSPGVRQWVPYQSEVTVDLAPLEGNRFISIRFRTQEGNETEELTNHIYLQPKVALIPNGGNFKLVLSKIIDLSGITIHGCQESYANVPYSTHYPCTASNLEVEAFYHLNDGTVLRRTAAFP